MSLELLVPKRHKLVEMNHQRTGIYPKMVLHINKLLAVLTMDPRMPKFFQIEVHCHMA